MPRRRLHTGVTERARLKVATIDALQRHLDSQPETGGITVPDVWHKLSLFPRKLGIRMVATTERGQETLQAIEERSRIRLWLNRTHHEWKSCLEDGEIKAVVTENEEPVAEEEEPIAEEEVISIESTPISTRRRKMVFNTVATNATRAAGTKRRAVGEKATDDEGGVDVKMEDGVEVWEDWEREASGIRDPRQKTHEDNVTDEPELVYLGTEQPRLRQQRNKRQRTMQGIGFGLLQHRAHSPSLEQHSDERTRNELEVQCEELIAAARVKKELEEHAAPGENAALVYDTASLADRLEPALRSPVQLRSVNQTPFNSTKVAGGQGSETRLAALEEGQRRLEGMMQEILGYVRPAPQLQL